MMLVHSFSSAGAWFKEFSAFSLAVGMAVDLPGTVSAPKVCGDVVMRLAWVSDEVADASMPAVR